MSSSSKAQTLNQSNSPSSLPEPANVTLLIDNFCSKTTFAYKDFSLPSNNQITFRLVCYPQNEDNKFKYNYTTIYLYLLLSNKDQITARNRIWFLKANGEKCYKHEIIDTFSKQNNAFGGLYHILYDQVKDPENGFLVNGKLSIYCEIEEINPKNSNLPVIPKLPDNPVLTNYQSLLESGKFSDVTLIIGEKKLLAHKSILAAQSQVFSAMFENDCEEKRKNEVTITDVPVDVCEQMLCYIYTGKIPLDLNEYAADLFVVADKYQLDHLKSICEQHLCTNLIIESVASTLLLADMHHTTVLKSKCIDYITDNMTKVMATDGWKGLMAARLELLKQIAIKTNR